MAFFFFMLAGLALYIYSDVRAVKTGAQISNDCPPPSVDPGEIVFEGVHPDISHDDITRILNKRCLYFSRLEPSMQNRFLERLCHFMQSKTFIIKDDEVFKEMPVLVSAAAIQLTFGMKDYQLPFFNYIRIFPEAYFAHDSFKLLAGNVQASTISVAWNHFLEGFADPCDGCNVGLHEMSHAVYFQKLVVEKGYAQNFKRQYNKIVEACEDAHLEETSGAKDIYSEYATKDIQEFWAESVELFFEKTDLLEQHYPVLFLEMKLLLNQDPRQHDNPLISDPVRRWRRLVEWV